MSWRIAVFFAALLASASASADDVVVTRDGRTYRGVIVDSMPGEYVVIVEEGARRRFDGAEIAFAGPREDAPTEQRLAPGAGVRLQLSAERGYVFHRVLGTSTATAWDHGPSEIDRLCAAPCELTLPAGAYRLAISRDDAMLIADEPIALMRSGRVHATHVDRSGLRIAGWLTMGLGLAGGIAMMTAPLAFETQGEADATWAHWVMAGTTVIVVTQIIGIILAVQPDTVAIRFD